MKSAALLLVTVIVATGCAAQPLEKNDMAADDKTDMAGEYAGKAYEEMVATLGAPENEEDFVMAWPQLEFRIELRNFFDRDSIDAGDITLRESTWSLEGTKNLTVWFQQDGEAWTALHWRRWEDGDLF